GQFAAGGKTSTNSTLSIVNCPPQVENCQLPATYGQLNIIFPICPLLSISRCASAACSAANTLLITGFIFSDFSKGQICSSRFRAIAALNTISLDRNVEPALVNRLVITGERSTCTSLPIIILIITRRPSFARDRILFCTYSPPTMSNITSTPFPPVTSFITS